MSGKEDYNLGDKYRALYCGSYFVKYSGIITGFSGLSDDFDLNKLCIGGLLYFIGSVVSEYVRDATERKRFETLENRIR